MTSIWHGWKALIGQTPVSHFKVASYLQRLRVLLLSSCHKSPCFVVFLHKREALVWTFVDKVASMYSVYSESTFLSQRSMFCRFLTQSWGTCLNFCRCPLPYISSPFFFLYLPLPSPNVYFWKRHKLWAEDPSVQKTMLRCQTWMFQNCILPLHK